MTHLHLDYETRSAIDLKRTGVYPYAADETTTPWCAAYAVDDGPVKVWVPGMAPPACIVEAAKNPEWQVFAHNAAFERAITRHVMTRPEYGWPDIPVKRWRCTMAAGYAMSLPGSLENMAAALNMDIRKDQHGHRLMMQMAKPRNVNPDGSLIWWDDEERRLQLYKYCVTDVEVERALADRILALRPQEQLIWWIDQLINDRGVCVDTEMCKAATQIVEAVQYGLDKEMNEVTGGEVPRTTNVADLKKFVREQGLEVESLNAAAIEELLQQPENLPPAVKRALELRAEAGRASVKKIVSLIDGVGEGGRHRGLLQYHAASTGRWAGRRFQPQNMRRPDFDEEEIQELCDLIVTGDANAMRAKFPDPLTAMSNCLRALVWAAPGNDLVAADFANIEGRVLAWMAGEEWKIKAFEDYDNGIGPDLYKVAYASSFNTPVEEVTSSQRQIGKVEELALGFGGGPGAFATMAVSYGVDIGAQSAEIKASAPDDVVRDTVKAWNKYGKKMGMQPRAWCAAEVVKRLWRAKHPEVVSMWRSLEEAAKQAVAHKGQQFEAYGVTYKVNGSFLLCRLPSGRAIFYPFPTLRPLSKKEAERLPWAADPEHNVLRYKGVDSRKQTGKWEEIQTYGGKLVENVVQAVARDVLAEAIIRLEKAKYPVVLHVHDEVVSEVPQNFGSLEEFESIMKATPAWATELPIAVEGWRGRRYRK